jgi:hypothetical protein
MSTRATMQSPLTDNQPGSDAQREPVADAIASPTPRRRKVRSPLSGALLLLLAVASIILWLVSMHSTAADGQAPQKWGYVLTVQGGPSKTFGPFADVDACNVSLYAVMADLNLRLPGLYVARPCAGYRS